MLLAHISDLHFRSEGKRLYDFIDTNGINAQIINHINSLPERPNALVITGDIVNCGEEIEYEYAKQILGYLDIPVYLIPGNHDNKRLFIKYLHTICPSIGFDADKIHYSVEMDKARLLFIDTSVDGAPHGFITDETLEWLHKELSNNEKRTYIFMHHPPVNLGNCQMDRIRCLNGDTLLALIERYSHIERVFCGHVHRTMVMQYRQALIMSISGTVHQVPYHSTDLTDRYNQEEGMMLMHHWVEGSGLVSYNYPLTEMPSYCYNPVISCSGK